MDGFCVKPYIKRSVFLFGARNIITLRIRRAVEELEKDQLIETYRVESQCQNAASK